MTNIWFLPAWNNFLEMFWKIERCLKFIAWFSIVWYCQRCIFRTFQNNNLSKHQHRHVVVIHSSHLIELLRLIKLFTSLLTSCIFFPFFCLLVYRFSCDSCSREYSYDGAGDGKLNMDTFCVVHSVCRDYMHHFLAGNG